MVFQKKGATAVKNDQTKRKGKKPFEVEEDDDLDMFEDMDDSDDDNDDSEEEMEVQKTPANKTPKGRQSLSEKKVSFDLTGKNNKTPKKDTSLVAKKQPTPAIKGRTPVQEFKGLKGKMTPQKGGDSEDDDDDDDDDEDDDLDLELDDEDGDEEEDDDEDDDDDDDDDEEDEEDQPKNAKGQNKNVKNQNNGGQNKQKTPVKTEKSKDMSTPKGLQTPKAAQTPKGEIKKEKTPKREKSPHQIDELERRRQRDVKMLYVGNLPKDATAAELRTLSTDILDALIPNTNRSKMSPVAFAFLSFASEAKAESNYQSLQTKKFRGQTLNIDFVGEKSKNKKPQDELKQYHPKKLFVTGIPLESTLSDVAKYFPKAFQITFNHSPLFRNATINYFTEDDANEEFSANTEVDIDGHKLTVLHCVIGKASVNKRNRRKRPFKGGKKMNHDGNPSKKMKVKRDDSDAE